MQNAVSFSNNDVVVIAWSYATKPVGCMGFALYRIDQRGTESVLPGFAIFKGDDPTKRPTDRYPIQKFYWKDLAARLVAERGGERIFRYKIVPLEGTRYQLTAMQHVPFLITNAVTVSSTVSDEINVVFNRGLISTQRIARSINDARDPKAKLLAAIASSTNPLRKSLAADMTPTLIEFLNRANTGGTIYAALYELADAELIEALAGLKSKLHIVLSNAAKKSPADVPIDATEDEFAATETAKLIDGNQAARTALARNGAAKWDRIMPTNHIGHNKFLVHVDPMGVPQSVLTGSTNWTSTGLCTQTNNTIVIDNTALAAVYFDYWAALVKDTEQAGGKSKSLQAKPLRDWAAQGRQIMLADGTALHSWFAPNTPAARRTKQSNRNSEMQPPDMADLASLIANAQQAILFLAFYPGTPSVADWVAAALKANDQLFVRGCVTNRSTAEGFYYQLVGGTQTPSERAERGPNKQDYRVIAAEAFNRAVPAGWQREILNAGFAIVHDKIVVIDPFSAYPIVAMGSHNLGHKAWFDNDENFLIFRGNRQLAAAYTTHVLDVYDHFSARYWFNHGRGDRTGNLFLAEESEQWLAKYFNADGEMTNAQLNFWMGAAM